LLFISKQGIERLSMASFFEIMALYNAKNILHLHNLLRDSDVAKVSVIGSPSHKLFQTSIEEGIEMHEAAISDMKCVRIVHLLTHEM
jgi:hypothetical protein